MKIASSTKDGQWEFAESIICREGQLTHLFFPGRVGRGYGPDWTLVVSPAEIIYNIYNKILYKMGPYASIWAHTLRIRSHIGYKGSGMPKIGLGHHNILKYLLDSGTEKFFPKNSKNITSIPAERGGQKS